MLSNIRDVSKLPLTDANNKHSFPLNIDLSSVPVISFTELYRRRKLHTERLRNAGTPIDETIHAAKFLTN
jgi:hypothetical protein